MLGIGGFGTITPQDVFALKEAMAKQRLRKALSAGYNDPAASVAQPLVPQSMEKTLASATYRSSDAVLWKKIPKVGVSATVNEFSRIEEHGSRDVEGWFSEGGSPLLEQSTYTRDFTRVKYIGVKGATTFAMMHSRIVGANATAEAEEVDRKTLQLIGLIEDALYFGDSSINPLAFDGLRATLEKEAPANIVDLRGQVLTGRQMREDMALQRDLFATPNLVVMSHGTRAILGNLEDPAIRRNDPSGKGARVGTTAEGLNADHGLVGFDSTFFLKAKTAILGSAGVQSAAIGPDPDFAAPTAIAFDADAGDNGANVALAGAEVSNWVEDDVGVYIYRIVAVSDHGHAASIQSASVTVESGKKNTMQIDDGSNDPTKGGNSIRYYKVFRSEKDGGDGTCRFIKNVAAATGAGLTTITDFNDDIPQTSWAFSLQMTPDVVEVVRLLDMMKQDLAIRSTTKEFLLILFAAFRSRTPTKLWAWKNCGQSL